MRTNAPRWSGSAATLKHRRFFRGWWVFQQGRGFGKSKQEAPPAKKKRHLSHSPRSSLSLSLSYFLPLPLDFFMSLSLLSISSPPPPPSLYIGNHQLTMLQPPFYVSCRSPLAPMAPRVNGPRHNFATVLLFFPHLARGQGPEDLAHEHVKGLRGRVAGARAALAERPAHHLCRRRRDAAEAKGGRARSSAHG